MPRGKKKVEGTATEATKTRIRRSYDELIAVQEKKVERAKSVLANAEEKLAALQAKKDAQVARMNSKAVKADRKKLMDALAATGKSVDEILALINPAAAEE